MDRSGTMTILGAGASTEAGYPIAGELLDEFRKAVEEESQRELQERERVQNERAALEQGAAKPLRGTKVLLPELRPQPTTREWFQTMWARIEQITKKLRPLAVPRLKPDGRPDLSSPVVYDHTGLPAFPPYVAPLESNPPSSPAMPYLETFFAFYDDYMRPIIAAQEGDPAALRTAQHRFRHLRELAIKTAFRVFSSYTNAPGSYLRRLFELPGPAGDGCAIATLNFDLTIEQIASERRILLWDGFAQEPGGANSPPPEWNEPGLENLPKLWDGVGKNGHDFIGFEQAPADSNIFLKLHGSLGWYVLEEGGGDIGARDELRHNTAYRHFRVPNEFFWRPDMQVLVDQLALGGADDPVTRVDEKSLSRKAGAVWVRPYLIFARALKAHPDRLSLELMSKFAELMDKAGAVLVIGYSWGDPHVNDLVFDAVARGASLINVSMAN